jgi:hypothetical protein
MLLSTGSGMPGAAGTNAATVSRFGRCIWRDQPLPTPQKRWNLMAQGMRLIHSENAAKLQATEGNGIAGAGGRTKFSKLRRE